MESRTASSNSIGPGMSSAGCAFWVDIFVGLSGVGGFCAGGGGGGGAGRGCWSFFSCGFARLTLPCSSSKRALRSVEKGVLISRNGLLSKCFAIWFARELAEARDVGAMRGNSRLFTEVNRYRWPRVHIRLSERCERCTLEVSTRDRCRCSHDEVEQQLWMDGPSSIGALTLWKRNLGCAYFGVTATRGSARGKSGPKVCGSARELYLVRAVSPRMSEPAKGVCVTISGSDAA
jgi:hypothetical protein